MYRAFYSLSQDPFTKDIRPQYHFPSRGFKEALARIRYLIETRGIGVILGEPGCGKTYALRSVAESLNPSLYRTAYLSLSTGTTMDMYRAIAAGLGEEPRFRKVDLFGQIQKAVGHLYYDKKITPVFIMDEMHIARSEFLLDLAMIFNFSMDSKNPFVLILSGLPFFQSRLRLNQAQPLAQRIIVQYKFEPLDKDEVKGYLDHRLRLVGAVTPIFTDQAIEAIASHTGGWPRLINNLASTALLYGAQLKRNPIDEDIIRMAAEETSL